MEKRDCKTDCTQYGMDSRVFTHSRDTAPSSALPHTDRASPPSRSHRRRRCTSSCSPKCADRSACRLLWQLRLSRPVTPRTVDTTPGSRISIMPSRVSFERSRGSGCARTYLGSFFFSHFLDAFLSAYMFFYLSHHIHCDLTFLLNRKAQVPSCRCHPDGHKLSIFCRSLHDRCPIFLALRLSIVPS
ncbi:hypothetical protein EDB83DRAFT_528851 [Lactarius deliciosus]|nr:hypothetical protein EDB83DRAFT_528851 [Lactarius deliciosus]